MNTIIIVYDPEQTDHKLEGEDESGRLGDLCAYVQEEFNNKHITAHVQEIAGTDPEKIRAAARHGARVLAAVK